MMSWRGRVQIQLRCGDEAFRGSSEKGLEFLGLSFSDDASLHLLIDRPLGWVSLGYPDVDHTPCVMTVRWI